MAGHVREIQYPTWLANVVMVRKSSGKWRMCTDFTDLSKACPKDSYPLPNIDCLNAGATYQRLMDKVLVNQLGRNVEAYVDDMVVKSESVNRHFGDLQELFDTIDKYQLKLNPDKCSFGVQAGKFLGFLLTHRGIEANPEKCSAIINMRSPSTVKEVQQLTGRMASLSRFLSRGAGIVLVGPGGILLEQSLRFEFRASNNQAEYEALLAGMALAKEMGATSLSARSDSQLITGQFTLNHVPLEQNSRVDLLSKLASTKKPGATRSIIQETLAQPSINEEELDSWMGPYIAYLTRGELPEDKKEASLIQRELARFVVINERLYRRGFSSPLLRCLTTSQAQRVMDEVHSRMCGSHIGGRALVYKVARAGYFWPSLRNDCVIWVQKCDRCQRHATLHHSPAERLHSILVQDFCKEVGIRMTFISVEHPQSNGQAESANKVILTGLKKRVQDSGASCEVPHRLGRRTKHAIYMGVDTFLVWTRFGVACVPLPEAKP
uniref:Retrovirus-related Pol polyprotein from transposon opus n=1 Tax=Cajanus cajan TaxID=3821 RepID=A0A151TV58_CAJCA|nr:Retrovirus-related Pol polyprotein from transposon opus [Cajanus cajan]